MACTTCSSGSCGTSNKSTDGTTKVAGCGSGGACGCNKMNVFDWLSNLDLPVVEKYNIVEVRFRNGRKEFFRNANYLDLTTGEAVIIEAQSGFDLGHITLQGELVRLQMLKKKVKESDDIKNILRTATLKDLEKYEQAQARNLPTLFRTRQIVQEQGVKMKLSDVEFQADNTKATFYYSADDRVDFRELIKLLAAEFKIRVEMKQISLRQEAGRLGGIGSCGRELCCSTWLTDFKSVSTSAARYQNLSLNPSKLSGQCGRLKCCLNYELETYMDALKDIPNLEKPLNTQKGTAHLYKTDIFKKLMWFGYNEETIWHPVTVKRVFEVMALNEKGIAPATLLEDEIEVKTLTPIKSSILDRVNESSKKSRKSDNKKNQKNNQNQGQKQNQVQTQKNNQNQAQKPNQSQKPQPKPNVNQNQNQKNKPKPNQGQKQNQTQGQNQGQKQNQGQNQKPQNKPNNNQNNQNNKNNNNNNNNNNQAKKK
ncbi:MAG: Signal peptidase-like protein [Microscillaceae bacterium]|nr:Signal peptidase-like protein [Microscillaceae bacterium]